VYNFEKLWKYFTFDTSFETKTNTDRPMLTLGSTGDDVKKLQEFLGITADGIFGNGTLQAVKNWQAQHGLTSDGIAGPKTLSAMGLLDTNQIDSPLYFEKRYMDKDEYYAGPTQKQWVFLHHTAGWHNPLNVVSSWNNDTRGLIATEFVLGGQSITNNDNSYDGMAVQAFPEGGYAWHLGIGNNAMHRNSVGIELCNFSWVKNGKTYVNSPVAASQIVNLSKPFRGFSSYHRYSDKQLETLKKLLLFIADRDSIDITKGLPERIKQIGADAFDECNIEMCCKKPGLWSHSNVDRGKFDVFPQPELIDMLLSM